MKRSYLGIADRAGLRLLVPETRHTDRFLVRRAVRIGGVCLWAVIDESFHHPITLEIESGHFESAARLLQTLSSEVGTILPSTYSGSDRRLGA
jgi:hypothetical protein